MRINSSGTLGIGTTSPQGKLTVSNGTDNNFEIFMTNPGGGSDTTLQAFNRSGSVYKDLYYTALNQYFLTGGTERMRIDSSGKVLINTTSTLGGSGATLQVDSGANAAIFKGSNAATDVFNTWNAATSGNNLFILFGTEGSFTTRGSIDYNRARGVVRYNTTSDETLKNIIGNSDKQKSINILNLTKIREYAWKDDPTQKTQIGVIAQELYETYKGAVSVGGEVENVDEEGNITTQYKPWGVDKTAFTFHLIAGWQEHEKIIKEQQAIIEELKATTTSQQSKIDSLEARLTALES